MPYQPDQSAHHAHEQLKAAIEALNQAEHNAVLWFADIDRRRLYRDLGFASMWQYATEGLGFSRTRAKDFLRLARRLDALPGVRRSIASGELGYTKAREIVKVADPTTEQTWLEAAQGSSRRELEEKVTRVRRKTRRRPAPGQAELLPPPRASRLEEELAAVAPVRRGVEMTAEQAARHDALWRELGASPNADDVLEALAALLEARRAVAARCDDRVPRGTPAAEGDGGAADEHAGGAAHPAAKVPRGTRPGAEEAAARATAVPPIQVHVHRCPECGAAEVDGVPLDRADRARTECDAAIAVPGERNRSLIPRRVRREVLARDRHRCQAPGCEHTRFLEIHHRTPRSRGGTNRPENLITLCSACHRLWHERGFRAGTDPDWSAASGAHPDR
ncbi:hypothetical protein GF314_14710 [bacterium]|nr:hypothetical protein [bacterium]